MRVDERVFAGLNKSGREHATPIARDVRADKRRHRRRSGRHTGSRRAARAIHPDVHVQDRSGRRLGIATGAGYLDYWNMLNIRDGGIGGVQLVWVECETECEVESGIACGEKLKHTGPTGAGVINRSRPTSPTRRGGRDALGFENRNLTDRRSAERGAFGVSQPLQTSGVGRRLDRGRSDARAADDRAVGGRLCRQRRRHAAKLQRRHLPPAGLRAMSASPP